MKINIDLLHKDFFNIPRKTTTQLIEALQNLYFVDKIYIACYFYFFNFLKFEIIKIVEDNPELGFQILKVTNESIELLYNNKIKIIKYTNFYRGIKDPIFRIS